MFSALTHDDPQQLGPYRLIARLGSGGMGTVYLARSTNRRTAALKTMHARIATDPTFRTRFRLEIDAARVIGGVHGAQVFDADPLAETPWLATEYVLGPPLDEAVECSGALPETAVRALGGLLCTALAQLHASDVVHRDLKPSNIMVTADGPKVIDFGIARAIGDERLTSTGAAAGTPAFMSPEQATGQEHTSAGDVFALAGVLTYAAAGHGPFGSGQPADLLYRVRYAEPDLTGVPRALAPILSRCLSKDPQDRPSTWELAAQLAAPAGDFADFLPPPLLDEIVHRSTEVWRALPERALYQTESSVEPATESAPTTPSRRKLLIAGGGSAIGVATAAAGTWAWLGWPGLGDDSGTPSPGAGPRPVTPPKRKWKWRNTFTPAPGLLVPPAVLDISASVVAVADGKKVQLIKTDDGSVEVSSVSKAPPHRCTTDGEWLYTCEPPKTANGPLAIKAITLTSDDLNPDPIEFKDFNGSLPHTQLLCATAEIVYIAAGQGPRPRSGPGFSESQDWFLLAVNHRTGKTLWRKRLPRRPATSQRLYFLAARIDKDFLVLLQETSKGKVELSVRDARTGNVRWEQALPVSDPEGLRGILAVDAIYGHVYPPAGPLRALQLTNGKAVWQADAGRARTGPPTIGNGTGTTGLFAVEEGLGLIAVDVSTGDLLWEEQGSRGATPDDLKIPPLVGSDYVYRKTRSQLLPFDGDTGLLGSTPLAVSGERFYALEFERRILALGKDFIAGYPLQ
ncbi:protein kinase [Streptomyces sp. T-3]|nr:protein kinase [Streptomyces sp. T-3]